MRAILELYLKVLAGNFGTLMLNDLFQDKIKTFTELQNHEFISFKTGFLQHLSHADFIIKDLDSAQQLAFQLSLLCPEPIKVAVGLLELLINAIEHGNLGITYDEKDKFNSEQAWLDDINHRLKLPKNIDKSVSVHVDKTDAIVQYCIKDCGHGFNWRDFTNQSIPSKDLKHGRGILLAQTLSFDKIEYSDSGNQVICSVYLN